MKILIVGGNSSVAQVLRPVLATFADVLTAGRSGCDVALDLSWPDDQFCLPQGLDCVIQLAAHFGGRDYDEMMGAEQVNVLGALKICRACTRAGVGHLVQVSSIFAGLSETSPFFGSYALSKRHAEEVARLYCDSSGLPLTILRPAQIYGEGESFRKHQPFLYSILDKAQNNEDIVLYGDNDAQRNLIHAEDVAEVIARVIQQRVLGQFACVGQTNVRYTEIAAAAIGAFDSHSDIRFVADKPNILDNAFAPDETLYRLIGYFPKISLIQGMAREAVRRKAMP
ncbi:NAD-dependent epimerase/dehydratase family protein [Paraburkholderia gardini]|uniref:NAD-dependent epimerase/dehydratase family protein n=1 Tax=Paraburkholderia gardini TaxID=2823469 RepID=UPI001D972778|nr:NAD(P)-dependent oxidoreductase [Paraburkholderia gardini]CAG4910342.1 GDP-L-fucose synthase [Paraburkholderia gardini]